jgi:hypothetical protein
MRLYSPRSWLVGRRQERLQLAGVEDARTVSLSRDLAKEVAPEPRGDHHHRPRGAGRAQPERPHQQQGSRNRAQGVESTAWPVVVKTASVLHCHARNLLRCHSRLTDGVLATSAGSSQARRYRGHRRPPADITAFRPSQPGPGKLLFRLPIASRTQLAVDLAGSRASAGVAATAETNFDDSRSGSGFATKRFATAADPPPSSPAPTLCSSRATCCVWLSGPRRMEHSPISACPSLESW